MGESINWTPVVGRCGSSISGYPALSEPIGISDPPIAFLGIVSGHLEALEVTLDGRERIFPRDKSIANLGRRG
jgi:hypothetical protein